MADGVKISELPDSNTLTGAEYVEVVQGGVNKKAPANAFGLAATLEGVLTNGNTTGTKYIILSTETPNRILYVNGAGQIVATTVSPSELGYLSGLVGNIQDQFNLDAWKQPCRAASTGNIDLSAVNSPTDTDGITLVNGDRFLVKDQTSTNKNGIYVYLDDGIQPYFDLAPDFNSNYLAYSQSVVRVSVSTSGQENTEWYLTNTNPVVVGVDNIIFEQVQSNISAPANEVVLGTGPNVASSTKFKFNPTTNILNLSDGTYTAGLLASSDGIIIAGMKGLLFDYVGTTNYFLSSNSQGSNLMSSFNATGSGNGGGTMVLYSGGDVILMNDGTNALKLSAGNAQVYNTLAYKDQYSASGTPSIVAGSAVGTGPTVSIVGTNKCGIITIITGTYPGSSPTGTMATVTFNSFTAPTNSIVHLRGLNTGAITVNSSVSTPGTATSFNLNINGAGSLAATTTYIFSYQSEFY